MWVGLGWVGFFLTQMVGWVKKFPQLDPTRSLHIFNLGSLVGKKLSQQISGLQLEPQQLAVC